MQLEIRARSTGGVDNRTPRQISDDLMTIISRMIERPRVAVVNDNDKENHKLIKLAQAGDIEARNKLIKSHMWLIDYTLKKHFRHSRSDFDDMRNDAVFGLIRAIMGFDAEKADALSTYATYWIRATVGRGRQKAKIARLSPDRKSGMLMSLSSALSQDKDGFTIEDTIADPNTVDIDSVMDADKDQKKMAKAVAEFWREYQSTPAGKFVGLKDPKLVKAVLVKRLLSSDPATLGECGEPLGHSRESARLYEVSIMKVLEAKLKK